MKKRATKCPARVKRALEEELAPEVASEVYAEEIASSSEDEADLLEELEDASVSGVKNPAKLSLAKPAELPDLDLHIGGEAYVLPASKEAPDLLHQLHGFSPWPGEDIAELRRRHDAYLAVKKQLDEDVGRIQSSVLSDVCSALVKFISEEMSSPEEDTIPTAILLTGYNLGDRAIMHEQICNLISRTDPIARVEPQNCGSLKRAVKHLMCSYIGANAKQAANKDWKLGKLNAWRASLPAAKRPRGLLVFFDEVQSCNITVLQDLMEVCRLHQSELRFLFVISLHSSVQALRELLPRSTMENLRIESFKLEPSVHWLKRIVSEVRAAFGAVQVFVSGRLPVRFSGSVLRDINCNFHTWNMSVWRYVRCIQLLILDYFSRPLSIYCLPAPVYTLFCAACLRVPYFPQYCAPFPYYICRLICRRSRYTAKELSTQWNHFIAAIRTYLARFPAIFRIYHSLISRPNEPSTLEHNVYATCLLTGREHALARAQQLPPALHQVWPNSDERRMHHRAPFDQSRLLTLIDLWLGDLRQLPESDPQKQQLLTELGDLKLRLTQESSSPYPTAASPRAVQSNPSARLAREQALADSLGSNDAAQARASETRRALRDWLERLFCTRLQAPDNFPLYELFFDTKLSLLNVLYPEMERELEGGLLNPARLIGCLCCGAHDIHSALPDICIAFQLMRKERTRELNLHDWLQSFSEVVASRRETKEQEQARFFHAVDSLQLLGYVRNGKTRKVDHIIRCDM